MRGRSFGSLRVLAFLPFFFFGVTTSSRSIVIFRIFFFGVIRTLSTALVGSSSARAPGNAVHSESRQLHFVLRQMHLVDLDQAQRVGALRRVANQLSVFVEAQRVIEISIAQVECLPAKSCLTSSSVIAPACVSCEVAGEVWLDGVGGFC